VNSAQTTAASQLTKQSCPSAGLQPRNHHAAGADIREVGAGLRFARPFLSALVVQSIYHFDRPPVQGLVLQNTFIERRSLPVSEALSRLDHRTVGACPRPCGYGRDGATRKGVRTALYVF
jgi:hypothetical protein